MVYILKKLINATLGNKVLDVLLSSIISFYLHLYNVEQNRKLLNSLKYDAFDEESKINKHFSILKNLSQIKNSCNRNCKECLSDELKELQTNNSISYFNLSEV